MKAIKTYLALALTATVALCACSADGDIPDTNPNFPQDGVMRFATAVSDAVQTRSFGYDDNNINTKDLYLWATPTGENPKDAYTYKGIILHYAAENGWGTYSSLGSDGIYTPTTLLWQDKTTPVEMVAASFGGSPTSRAELNTEATISVYSYQTFESAITGSDYLYFKGTVDPAATADVKAEDGSISEYALVDGKVRLPLRHINSKLNITLTLGTEFNATADVLGLGKDNPLTEVKVNNVYTQRRFNMVTTVFGDFKDSFGNAASLQSIALSSDVTLGTWTPAATATGKAVATYRCILIPQTVTAGTFSITFTLGDKTYKWTPTKDVTFDSGKEYKLDLTVGKDIVTIQGNGITVGAWGVGTPENNGNIETE